MLKLLKTLLKRAPTDNDIGVLISRPQLEQKRERLTSDDVSPQKFRIHPLVMVGFLAVGLSGCDFTTDVPVDFPCGLLLVALLDSMTFLEHVRPARLGRQNAKLKLLAGPGLEKVQCRG